MIYKSNNWATDERIISWLDQAIRSSRNDRLQSIIDEDIPTSIHENYPVLWIQIYKTSNYEATEQVLSKPFLDKVAECFQHEKKLGAAWIDYKRVATAPTKSFGAQSAIVCYYLWQTCPNTMSAFVQRSNRYLPLAAIREATLADYFKNAPDLVTECEQIDMIAFQEDMSRYLQTNKLASKTMIKPIRSVSQNTRSPRDTTSYKSQQREPSTPKYQHREPPNQKYQNTAKHECYICDGKPHSEPHTSTNCPCTIRNLASGHMFRRKMAVYI